MDNSQDKGTGVDSGGQSGFRRAEYPELVFEVEIATGSLGETLRRAQIRAIREVTEWVAQQRSRDGENPSE